MRFAPVEMLSWAKAAFAGVPCHIGRSGMPPAPRELFGDALRDLPIEGTNEWGDEGVQAALAARFGISHDEILIAPGTTGSNFFAAAALVDEGDEALVEEPTYGPLLQLVQALTRNVRRFPRPASAGFLPDLGVLGRSLGAHTRLVVLTNFHNPSGTEIPPDAMARLLDLVESRSPAHVLCDEVYLEMADDPGATAYRTGRRVVTTRSLTKAYGLNWVRAGWIMAPRDVVAKARTVRDYVNVIDPYPATAVMAAALARLPALRARCAEALTAQDRLMRSFLASRDDLPVVWPAKPFLFFPRVLRARPTAEIASGLRHEAGVSVVPGELFGAPGHIRVGAIGRPDLLEVGLPKLAAHLDRLDRI